MGEENNQKSLGGMMDGATVRAFCEQADRIGGKIKRHLEAAARLWITLPDDVKTKFLDQSLDAATFVGLVQQIVDERIEAGYSAGTKLARSRKRKPRPRD
jgi:hypothetical protein